MYLLPAERFGAGLDLKQNLQQHQTLRQNKKSSKNCCLSAFLLGRTSDTLLHGIPLHTFTFPQSPRLYVGRGSCLGLQYFISTKLVTFRSITSSAPGNTNTTISYRCALTAEKVGAELLPPSVHDAAVTLCPPEHSRLPTSASPSSPPRGSYPGLLSGGSGALA